MSDIAIQATSLGKMYRIYQKPSDKILDVFGFTRFMPWKRNHCREFWALRDFNLHIHKGERIGLIGRNGAGKSTLLKIISGSVTPTEGSIRINGQVQALMELGTGFHPEFTGRENIHAALAYHGFTSTQIKELEEEIIDFSELDEFIDQPVKSYSAGMYARLAFSASTSIKPEILIIDEVLGAGDAYFSGKCMERMRRLTSEEGVTVLFVSHDISSVQQLCTRAIWIDKGQIIEEGTTVDVVKSYYRSIQREEALRRKAQARGLRKTRDLEAMESLIERQVLFRFVVESGTPKYQHKIRKIELKHSNVSIASLNVGAPMDNQLGNDSKILDEPGYMDWSNAQKDSIGAFRFYENRNSSYHHAPFEFRIFSKDFPSHVFEMVIEGEFNESETVHLELYWDNSYHLVGYIQGGTSHSFLIPDLSKPIAPQKSDEASNPKNQTSIESSEASGDDNNPRTSKAMGIDTASIVSWERPDPRIETVRFLDKQGEEVIGIEELGDLIVEIEYFSSRPVFKPVFSLSILQANGTLLCHANSALNHYVIDKIEGKGVVQFIFPEFSGTSGDYLLGCSIFHYLDPKQYFGQPPYYDQHDRAYRFKIWKKMDNNMALGCVRLPFTTLHLPETIASLKIS